MNDGIYVRVKYRDEICFEQEFRAISGDTIVLSVDDFVNEKVAAERERIKWDSIHSCHPECDKPVCVAMRKAVEDEREACAQIAFNAKTYIEAAHNIRERGAP